jgi:hypothetical protein
MAMATCSAGDESVERTLTPEPGRTPAAQKADVPQQGTLDEARAMLDRAVAHYQDVGREQALEDFTARAEPFVARDLYVFCYGPDRLISAHGADTALVGAEIDELRDVDGFAFGPAILDTAMAEPEGGQVAYKWMNPVTEEVEPKVSFVRKVGDDVCGVGAYGGATME